MKNRKLLSKIIQDSITVNFVNYKNYIYINVNKYS